MKVTRNDPELNDYGLPPATPRKKTGHPYRRPQPTEVQSAECSDPRSLYFVHFATVAINHARQHTVPMEILDSYRTSAWIVAPETLSATTRIAYAILFGRHGLPERDSHQVNQMLDGLTFEMIREQPVLCRFLTHNYAWNLPEIKNRLLSELTIGPAALALAEMTVEELGAPPMVRG